MSGLPKYIDMVKEAISALADRKGSSRQAISAYIQSNYKIDAARVRIPLNNALRKGIESGVLVHPPAHSGSYKLSAAAKKSAPKKKAAPKKKTATKKKKAAPKKKSTKSKKKAAPKKKKVTKKKSKKGGRKK